MSKFAGKQGIVASMLAVLCSGLASAGDVAWWRFETDNGAAVTNAQSVTRVDDSSGNGWHLTNLVSGTTYAANANLFPDPIPIPGLANDFGGKFSGGGLRNATVDLDGVGDTTYTLELFFRKTSHATMTLFYTGDGASPGSLVVRVNWAWDGSKVVPTHLRWSLAGVFDRNSGAAIVSSNTTYHLAVVRNGSTISLYLDGQLYDSTTLGSAPLLSGITFGASSAGYGAFLGSMDEFRVSDEALPPRKFLNAVPQGTVIAVR